MYTLRKLISCRHTSCSHGKTIATTEGREMERESEREKGNLLDTSARIERINLVQQRVRNPVHVNCDLKD